MQLRTQTTVTIRTLQAILASAFLFTSILFPSAGLLNAGAFDTLKEFTAGIESSSLPQPTQPASADLVRAVRPLKVYFLNVGQGDSSYIELPNGTNALIDAGRSKSKTSYLASFLREHNVAKIDNVVLTHPHADHYTGLQYVFSNIPVTNFFDTQADNIGTTVDEAIRAKAQALGVNIVHPAAGDTLAWDSGEVRVKVLNSCSEPVSSGSGQFLNDCSIVLMITYQNTSMLFAGDMQEDVEAELVDRYGSDLKADVLKVGHHGSQYSSGDAFLAAVHPREAYISVGQNNYGHPMPSCLARLQGTGAVVHRTDLEGIMEYTIGSIVSPSIPDALASLTY
ncbi:MAG: ComEC/Rec2 family competence protein [Elusimicrobiota bacterium]